MLSKTSILKLHYFIHGAGAAPINPYITIIIKQLGMSVSSMGPILFIIQILGLFFKPLFGILMDRSRRKTLVFQLAIAGSLIYYGLNILPSNGTFRETFNLNLECSQPGHLKSVVTQGIVSDLCLKHKFNLIYRTTPIECDFHCVEANRPDFRFKGRFLGKSIDLIHKGHLRVLFTHDVTNECRPQLRCSTKCPKFPEVQQVLNNYMTNSRYLVVVMIWVIGQVCYSVVNSIQDAVCQKICNNLVTSGNSGKGKTYYGQQRTWSSVGYGLSAIFIGNAMDHYNETNLVYDYSPVFNLLLVLWSFDIILVGFLKIPIHSVQSEQQQLKKSHQLKAVCSLIWSNRNVAIFLFNVAAVGVCYGALSIQMLFLENLSQRTDCNGSLSIKTLGGFVLLFHTLGEFPIFFYSHKFEERIGHKGMMSIVLLTFSLRFLYYSTVESPWAVLLMELSSGLTTGLFWPAISSYNSHIAPEHSSATMLSVIYSLFDACGVGLGGLFATIFYDSIGGKMIYAIYGLFAFMVFILHHFFSSYEKDSLTTKKIAKDEKRLLV